MEWITTRISLDELVKVNADPAFIETVKLIAKNFGIKEEDAEFVRKGITPSDLKVDEEEKAIVSYITTKAVDRDGEIVDPDGAILDDYRKHLVVLFGHDYKQLPIGKNIWIKQDKKGLVAKTVYANHAEAQKVYQYRKDGFPLAQSIGFVPVDVEDFPAEAQQKNGGVKRHYKKWALLEYSDVPIPSNPEALQVAISKGLSFPETLKDNPQYDPETVIKLEDIEATKEQPEPETKDEMEETIEKVETTASLHRIPVPDEEGEHEGHKIRTITISEDDGIQALYCVDCKTNITYLFDKEEWDLDEAKDWVKEHTKGEEEEEEEKEEETEEKNVVSSVAVVKAIHDQIDEGVDVIDTLFLEGDITNGKVILGRKYGDSFMIHGAVFSYSVIDDEVELGDQYLIDAEEVKSIYPEYFVVKEEEENEDIVEKAGRVLSSRNVSLIEETIDQVKEALAALEDLLTSVSGEKEEKEEGEEEVVEKQVDLTGIEKELEERKEKEVPKEQDIKEEDVRKLLEGVLGNVEKTLLNKATEAAEISIRKLLGKVS